MELKLALPIFPPQAFQVLRVEAKILPLALPLLPASTSVHPHPYLGPDRLYHLSSSATGPLLSSPHHLLAFLLALPLVIVTPPLQTHTLPLLYHHLPKTSLQNQVLWCILVILRELRQAAHLSLEASLGHIATFHRTQNTASLHVPPLDGNPHLWASSSLVWTAFQPPPSNPWLLAATVWLLCI